jgi:hypothetical protein
MEVGNVCSKIQGNDTTTAAVASDSTKTDSTAVVVKVEEPKNKKNLFGYNRDKKINEY